MRKAANNIRSMPKNAELRIRGCKKHADML